MAQRKVVWNRKLPALKTGQPDNQQTLLFDITAYIAVISCCKWVSNIPAVYKRDYLHEKVVIEEKILKTWNFD